MLVTAGLVVAPQPLAAEAGAAMLSLGGNVYDAAVAAAFVQGVTDPLMCGLGGIGLAQLFDPVAGRHLVIDFAGTPGSLAHPELWASVCRELANGKVAVEQFANYIGYQAIVTPGTVAGLSALHQIGGRLPWREVLQPAVTISRRGYLLPAYVTDYFDPTRQFPQGEYFPPFEQFINASPAMARLWLDEQSRLYPIGSLVKNDDYTATMEQLARRGAADFYTGELSQAIIADFAANGALITAEDLANFRPQLREPLKMAYRGHTVATNPFGGVSILQLLAVLEAYDLPALHHNSADYLDILATAMRLVFAERSEHPGDPQELAATLPQLLSPEHLAHLRERVARRVPDSSPPPEDFGTTHLTAADNNGRLIALTHTLGTGAGVVTEGLGFQYNSGMNAYDPRPNRPSSIGPGRIRPTAMAPTLVFAGEQPVMALGSPGSNAIINAIVQVIANRLDFGMGPLEAVAASRIHCEGPAVLIEARLPRLVGDELGRRGHQIQRRAFAYDPRQGRVQLVVYEQGRWIGASDPRRDGGVAAYADEVQPTL